MCPSTTGRAAVFWWARYFSRLCNKYFFSLELDVPFSFLYTPFSFSCAKICVFLCLKPSGDMGAAWHAKLLAESFAMDLDDLPDEEVKEEKKVTMGWEFMGDAFKYFFNVTLNM